MTNHFIPHVFWDDEEWRKVWLNGLTDEELDSMSPFSKGQCLPAYYFEPGGSEWYGPSASHLLVGIRFLEQAGLDLSKLTLREKWRVGKHLDRDGWMSLIPPARKTGCCEMETETWACSNMDNLTAGFVFDGTQEVYRYVCESCLIGYGVNDG